MKEYLDIHEAWKRFLEVDDYDDEPNDEPDDDDNESVDDHDND